LVVDGYSTFHEKTYKGNDMKKKLLVLLIAVIPTLMPNLASAIAIDPGDGLDNPPPVIDIRTHG